MNDQTIDAVGFRWLDEAGVKNRCIILKRRTDLQKGIGYVAISLLAGSFFLLQNGYLGFVSRHSGAYSPPEPVLIPFGFAVLAASVLLFASLFGFRHYYILDPVERTLYNHFQFLWWRRRKLIFKQGQIVVIVVEGVRKATRYGSYMAYRLVAEGTDGHEEALTDWKKNGLEKLECQAREMRRLLQCR